MSEEKPTRRTRKTTTKEKPKRETADGYLEQWGKVVRGVVDLKVDQTHQEILDVLKRSAKTGSELLDMLDIIAARYVDAKRLAAKARIQYEEYKEDWAVWLEAKKTSARMALEEEKKEKDWKKQITQDMIMDQVRVTWETEYTKRFRRLKEFQAAVHELEALPEALNMRARALKEQKDILLATGPSGR